MLKCIFSLAHYALYTPAPEPPIRFMRPLCARYKLFLRLRSGIVSLYMCDITNFTRVTQLIQAFQRKQTKKDLNVEITAIQIWLSLPVLINTFCRQTLKYKKHSVEKHDFNQPNRSSIIHATVVWRLSSKFNSSQPEDKQPTWQRRWRKRRHPVVVQPQFSAEPPPHSVVTAALALEAAAQSPVSVADQSLVAL